MIAAALTVAALFILLAEDVSVRGVLLSAQLGNERLVRTRVALATGLARHHTSPGRAPLASGTQRRQAVDAFWGEGPSTEEKLAIFDKFWQYTDEKYATFHGIDVNWRALRDKYRPEIAAGVSRGRMSGIMSVMTLALIESHSQALDLDVNVFTVPQPGAPVFAVGSWIADPSGACATALPDGSSLIYSAVPDHPLGLEPGDRVLGYDGKPWPRLYRQLLEEEMPLWPLWWGSSPSSYEHAFVMAAISNYHLFDVIDIKKANGTTMHVPTSLMPGTPLWHGWCSEQLPVPGVPQPTEPFDDPVSWGIVEGTNIGYIYVWGWSNCSCGEDFAQAVDQLTQQRRVDGLIIDFRLNVGGFVNAPLKGIGGLFPHRERTIGLDERRSPDHHLKMRLLDPPSEYRLDVDPLTGERYRTSYDGPIAVLVGPGALSAGDLSSFWMTFHPRARSFGKSTSAAFNLPTQPALGTGDQIDLHPDWFARIAEASFWEVRSGHQYLTHREFPVQEDVWLRPKDVAAGVDTVVQSALRWLEKQH
jgi:hypothetical protein